jgi:hypothetical protein
VRRRASRVTATYLGFPITIVDVELPVGDVMVESIELGISVPMV